MNPNTLPDEKRKHKRRLEKLTEGKKMKKGNELPLNSIAFSKYVTEEQRSEMVNGGRK